MRLVLEDHRRGGEHDVGEQEVFGVQAHWAVHRGDQRHLNVEDVHEDFLALAINLVVAPWGGEIEAVGGDPFHERIAAAREDYHTIIGIRANGGKQVHELFVRVSVEDHHTAVRVQRHFKHRTLR